jgi:hypothetical protein
MIDLAIVLVDCIMVGGRIVLVDCIMVGGRVTVDYRLRILYYDNIMVDKETLKTRGPCSAVF